MHEFRRVAGIATVMVVSAVIGAAMPACGGDDTSATPLDAGLETSTDVTVAPPVDTGVAPIDTGVADAAVDSGPGGPCTRPGEVSCNGKCVNLRTDPANCGGCNNSCGAGTVCNVGSC